MTYASFSSSRNLQPGLVQVVSQQQHRPASSGALSVLVSTIATLAGLFFMPWQGALVIGAATFLATRCISWLSHLQLPNRAPVGMAHQLGGMFNGGWFSRPNRNQRVVLIQEPALAPPQHLEISDRPTLTHFIPVSRATHHSNPLSGSRVVRGGGHYQ